MYPSVRTILSKSIKVFHLGNSHPASAAVAHLSCPKPDVDHLFVNTAHYTTHIEVMAISDGPDSLSNFIPVMSRKVEHIYVTQAG